MQKYTMVQRLTISSGVSVHSEYKASVSLHGNTAVVSIPSLQSFVFTKSLDASGVPIWTKTDTLSSVRGLSSGAGVIVENVIATTTFFEARKENFVLVSEVSELGGRAYSDEIR